LIVRREHIHDFRGSQLAATDPLAGAQAQRDAVGDIAIVLKRATPPAFARLPFNWQQHLQITPLDLRRRSAIPKAVLPVAARMRLIS
jgi:hypothetical protein